MEFRAGKRPDHEIEELVQLCSAWETPLPRVFQAGDTICTAGEPLASVFLIRSGEVLLQLERGRFNFPMTEVHAGEFVPASAVVGAGITFLHAIARTEVNAVQISTRTARKVFEARPDLYHEVSISLAALSRAYTRFLAQVKSR